MKKKNKKIQKVQNSLWRIDRKELATYFVDIEVLFKRFSTHVLDKDNPEKRRIFIDNGENILFVAHMDTVKKPKLGKLDLKRGVCHGAGFDDRLGIYTIFKLLNNGFKADVLLTDCEESGCSTASYHDLKDYDLIIEFDRAGEDVVTYDRDCPELLNILKKIWPVGIGAFSDVCFMDTDTCCINVGLGIRDSHSAKSRFILADYYRAMMRFEKFYKRIKNIPFRCDYYPDVEEPYHYGSTMYTFELCDVCGHSEGKEIHGYYICRECLIGLMTYDSGSIGSRDWDQIDDEIPF
jgi:hypothetical protein